MTSTSFALLGYISWTLFLVILIELLRIVVTLKTGRAASDFLPDGSDVSPFAHRLARAHANCYENFPIIGGILLFSIILDQVAITDSLAIWLLIARLGQSCIHLISGSSLAIHIRFLLYILQLGIVTFWIWQIVITW